MWEAGRVYWRTSPCWCEKASAALAWWVVACCCLHPGRVLSDGGWDVDWKINEQKYISTRVPT